MNISVIIPSYKKTDMLRRNLEHNLHFLDTCEIVVVNDDPDEDLSKVLSDYPVELIQNEKNLGFAPTVNKGICASQRDFVMLLNTDVRLIDRSFEKSLKHFTRNPNLFAVSFAQNEKSGEIVGKNTIYWKSGFVHHSKADNLKAGINAWAEGGSAIFAKDVLKELNYFDPLFSPFYWEDIDLSYRAWKTGYKILFDPDILVQHHHETTIGEYFRKSEIQKIAFRNQLLFIWKNIQDKSLYREHLINLFVFLGKNLFTKDSVYVSAFLDAWRKTYVLKEQKYILTDKEVFNLFDI